MLRHESKCATLHGHRYAAEVTCSAPALDSVGRVIDFGVVKERVGSWIDETWDHTTLVNAADAELIEFCRAQHQRRLHRRAFIFPGEPTAENIAHQLMLKAQELLAGTDVTVRSVRVYETPNCYAEVSV